MAGNSNWECPTWNKGHPHGKKQNGVCSRYLSPSLGHFTFLPVIASRLKLVQWPNFNQFSIITYSTSKLVLSKIVFWGKIQFWQGLFIFVSLYLLHKSFFYFQNDMDGHHYQRWMRKCVITWWQWSTKLFSKGTAFVHRGVLVKTQSRTEEYLFVIWIHTKWGWYLPDQLAINLLRLLFY